MPKLPKLPTALQFISGFSGIYGEIAGFFEFQRKKEALLAIIVMRKPHTK